MGNEGANTTFGTDRYGRVTRTRDPRILRLGLKLGL